MSIHTLYTKNRKSLDVCCFLIIKISADYTLLFQISCYNNIMKTLIIDNHTKHLKKLIPIFQNVTVIKREGLQENLKLTPYDLLVLSGGSKVPTVLRHPEKYKLEMDIIKKSKIPIIGICLGAEIITKAFNGELQSLPAERKGSIRLKITDPQLKKIICSKIINVFEGHHIGIKTIPKNFISCAYSKYGIEIIKHKNKPIIAVQFHPEISKDKKLTGWLLKEIGVI